MIYKKIYLKWGHKPIGLLYKNSFIWLLKGTDLFQLLLWIVRFHDGSFSLMNSCNMRCHVGFSIKSFVTNYTSKWFLLLMNWSDMFFHVTFLRATEVTYITFNWLRLLMNWCKMSFQVRFSRAAVVTNFTCKWLFVLMKWFYMYFQVILSRIDLVTHLTFELLLLIMDWFKIGFEVTNLVTPVKCVLSRKCQIARNNLNNKNL